MITLAFDTCLDKMYTVLRKDGQTMKDYILNNVESLNNEDLKTV